MWFKNLRLFCLTQEFNLSVEELEAQLIENAFIPCTSYEKSCMGWVSPLSNAAFLSEGEDNKPMLTHVVGDYIMLCAQKQDRLLPATVVREATDEKVGEIEHRQARKIYRKERREIQDDVFSSLLPRAFTRSARIHAYIAVKEKLLVVDAATAPKAEEFLNKLVANKEVSIKRITNDRYERTVGELFKNDINIQELIVEKGYGNIYKKYAYQCEWSKK